MKQLTLALTAHVDAGKTTLAEALLCRTGELRHAGRVDHGNSFMDTDAQEKARGITIFSSLARFQHGETRFTLLDTPGHVDFAAETERTLQVLDVAVLVISGTDGVQSHTRTLWNLLQRYGIPTVLFVNKMDIAQRTPNALMQELQAKLSAGCVRFDTDWETLCEAAGGCSESLMEAYFGDGITEADLQAAIAARTVFPVCFGAARDMKGITALLDVLDGYCIERARMTEFAARVFKLSVDTKGNRLTYMKLLGGSLEPRDELSYTGGDGKEYTEKLTGIRYYAGAKYTQAERVTAGEVFAVTGLSAAYPGMCLGACTPSMEAALQPMMQYLVELPPHIHREEGLSHLRQLEAEDPQLHVRWNAQQQKITVALMGTVQVEVLCQQMLDRFGYAPVLRQGMVNYRETVRAPSEGIGHYEPLRHYAEVHLLLEPLPTGSGLQFATICPEDKLDRNWQRLILSHLKEKEHLGVLLGCPITDMKLTLVSGKSHLKHTEGGDFRQATWRAVRHGLMRAETMLLEPWYAFTLTLPPTAVGKAMFDLERMAASFSAPETEGDFAVITGKAPVSEMEGYAERVRSYTQGEGSLQAALCGWLPCHNEAEVLENGSYCAEEDTENPASSVFCSHGAGYVVPWQEVASLCHLPCYLDENGAVAEALSFEEEMAQVRRMPMGASASDEELLAIFERTYGTAARKTMRRNPKAEALQDTGVAIPPPPKTEYLLVDGYNIIFAWDELKALAKDSLDYARDRLIQLLQNYQGCRGCEVILVFDAYRVKGHGRELEQQGNISVVYTKEAETADSYIERVSKKLLKNNRVRVATSDALEQLIILGNGALRISAREFLAEMREAEAEMRRIIGG